MVVKCAVYCHCPLFSLMSETKNKTTVVNFVFRSPFSVIFSVQSVKSPLATCRQPTGYKQNKSSLRMRERWVVGQNSILSSCRIVD